MKKMLVSYNINSEEQVQKQYEVIEIVGGVFVSIIDKKYRVKDLDTNEELIVKVSDCSPIVFSG